MKTGMKLFIGILVLLLAVGMVGIGKALADDYTSPSDINGTGENTLAWSGQGGGGSFSMQCDGDTPPGTLLWIFTFDGGDVAPDPVLTINGTDDYSGTRYGNEYHFYTNYYEPNPSDTTAVVAFDTTDTGNGSWNLVISHGCPEIEDLDVSKTVDTSYTRTHDWSIEKDVDPTSMYLYIPGQGEPSSGTATWTVDVTYEGYEDSDWNVSGTITIENTGSLDAVITSVEDVLAGSSISVDCGVTFPYILPAGATLTCSYDEDGYVEGVNVATVTTGRDTYSSGDVPIVWGDPTTEVNKTVTIKDYSDLFGTVTLGTVTAPDDAEFTYSKTFNWSDFGASKCGNHTYHNDAKVIGDGDVVLDEDDASITVHVQCYVYETAYGLGDTPTCFIPTFSNWGWTNYIAGPSFESWDLWAGAGQCDTSKGTLVGTVSVTYSGTGYVFVTFNVAPPNTIQSTHVYAGYNLFPTFKGKDTVAPGQYTNKGPFSGPIYVIAHAIVGFPDPSFGP
jgi:hypothetical protein